MAIDPSAKLEQSGIRETGPMKEHRRERVRRDRAEKERVVSTEVGAACRRGSVNTILGGEMTITVEQGGSEGEKRVGWQGSGRKRSESGECGGVGCKPVGYVERTRVSW